MKKGIYLPVNWLDGMNINQSHFVMEQMSNLFYQMSVLKNQLSPFDYGLLVHDGANDYQLWMDINNNTELNVELNFVSVLFPCGYLLEFKGRDESFNVFQASIPNDDANDEFLVVLSINPDERLPYGEPDPEEIPIRKPGVIPEIRVSVVANDQMKDGYFGQHLVVIGRLLREGESWQMDKKFVPPVQRVSGMPSLVKQYHQFENCLSSIERSTIEIIQKIRLKKQNNELATILFDISIRLNSFLVDVLSEFKVVGVSRRPIDIFIPFVKMARLIQNILDMWQGCGKDEMMTYLSDWCDISQGEFESMIQNMIKLKYNHNDIAHSISETTQFADVISTVFTVLASLDFIGKKIETSLFVAEEQEEKTLEAVTTKKKRKFNLLGN